MNTAAHRRGIRVAAAVIAAGVASIGFATTANAANVIDPDERGSLTIHKYEAPVDATGLANDGTEQDVSLAPLAGVGFTVYKIDDIDLTANSGWSDAAALSKVFDGTSQSITGAGYTINAIGSEQLTNASGEIALQDLDLGLYYVVETGPLPGSNVVAPFLVTVPLTDPVNDNTWLYDVHVYPKNALTTMVKEVKDDGAVQLGDEIVYTLTGDIPNVAVVDGYKIVDDLDAKLDYVSATVALSDGTPLVAGTDYTITPAAATVGGPVVEVVMTEAGRAILQANTDLEVVVDITTKVNTIGEIANQAVLYPNQSSFTATPGEGGSTITTEIVTKWGEITVQKVDPSSAALTGAVFSVYETEKDAREGKNPIEIDGATEFPAGADGTLTISGLRYSDWANNAAVARGADGYQSYWLAEVVAPDGYELLADPIEFDITAATSAAGIDLKVVNVESNAGFKLPLTGGTGTFLFIGGGALLLVGATIFAVHARRKNKAAA